MMATELESQVLAATGGLVPTEDPLARLKELALGAAHEGITISDVGHEDLTVYSILFSATSNDPLEPVVVVALGGVGIGEVPPDPMQDPMEAM